MGLPPSQLRGFNPIPLAWGSGVNRSVNAGKWSVKILDPNIAIIICGAVR